MAPRRRARGGVGTLRRALAAARERGIAVLDYTELLAERGELFVDYGHLHADGLRELALTTPEGEVWLWRP